MPAVQLTRLKFQIDGLVQYFEQPEEFRRGLHALCEYYSDRTYRPGQAVPMAPIVPSFHIPALVVRQLDLALDPIARENPSTALALADNLWQDEYMEPRLVAIGLLGSLPLEYAPELVTRLQSWCSPREDKSLLRKLLSEGSEQLRRKAPNQWLELVKNWLDRAEPAYQAMGLRALLPLIEDQDYENLPAVYSALAPVMQANLGKIQNDLSEVLLALSRRSPMETAYFLRQILSMSSDPLLVRLARRCLPLLGPAQSTLRNLLTERTLR